MTRQVIQTRGLVEDMAEAGEEALVEDSGVAEEASGGEAIMIHTYGHVLMFILNRVQMKKKPIWKT
jgi:hypothetical protein